MKKKSCQKTPTDQSENSVQPAGADRIEAENGDEPVKEHKVRKKNLSWKCDTGKDDFEDITAETSLLPESNNADARAAVGLLPIFFQLIWIRYFRTRIDQHFAPGLLRLLKFLSNFLFTTMKMLL